VSKIIVRLIKIIMREGAVRMCSRSQIGVNDSMNVYVPYCQEIKDIHKLVVTGIYC
jgi:hypothetical protein